MNTLRNKVQLIGRLGMDPEMKEFGQSKMARFSIATSDIYKDADGKRVEETTWHTVVAWGKLAEIIGSHLKKGAEVAIEGKLVNRNYEDKDGIKRYVTEIKANELVMLGKKATAAAE